MKNKQRQITVLEKYLFPNPAWQEGYRAHMRRFGKASGWFALVKEGGVEIVKLDRKGGRSGQSAAELQQDSSCEFHQKYAEQLIRDDERLREHYQLYKDKQGRRGALYAIRHLGRLKGLFFICGITEQEKRLEPFLELFEHFLVCQTELAHKSFELNNFYETVHPRALALSTMHSVHRVISSSLRLQDLLPRIGRLSAQVLKAKGCSILLVDPERLYLSPYFSFGEHPRFIHRQRIKIGRGLEGRIAATGEFYLSRNAIGVPFIEDDVVGVILLWHKIDRQTFTKIDLEILKSLSEQAVVAIKNAQLFEETEKLTLGSIKTINELLELNFRSSRKHLDAFSKIVLEVGKEMGLSSREQTHIERAIFLLDTGTLALPDSVLSKQGKLTKREYDMIKRVPMQGAQLLKSISSLKPVIPIVRHHHERFDGKGYPQGLKGDEIPVGARIVSVVNSFVAMISKRSYRERMTLDQSIHEIEANRGTQFDPKVVDAFMRVIQRKELQHLIAQSMRSTDNEIRHRQNGANPRKESYEPGHSN